MYIKRNPFIAREEAAGWFQSYLGVDDQLPCVNRTKMTQSVYRDIEREYPPNPHGLEDKNLLAEVFSLLYADSSEMLPREKLRSAAAFSRIIFIKALTAHPDYLQLKQQCTDNSLPAYFAAQEFCRHVPYESPALERFKKWTAILALLERQSKKLVQAILREGREAKCIALIVKLKKKNDQREEIRRKVYREMMAAQPGLPMETAIEEAYQKAEMIRTALKTWGTGRGDNTPLDQKAIRQVSQSTMLQEISKLVGKYREMLVKKRANGYRFGTGEKYDVSTGSDIDHCLPSEWLPLVTPETQAVFWDKYSRGQLAQIRLREQVKKGEGDIIIALDESGSMGPHIAWAKALFLALLDITAQQRRKLALIHFGSEDEIRIDYFLPGKYTRQDKLDAALHFWDGGTDFVKPLKESMQLLTEGDFKKADVLFITDGICSVPTDFAQDFQNFKKQYRVTLTSILLDLPEACDPTFRTLCDKVYQAPQMDTDQIAVDILASKSM